MYYTNNGFFWGCDGFWYGYMGFAHQLQADWAYYTLSDESIPAAGGFHTTSDDPQSKSVQRFIDFLKACKVPFSQWDYRSRQISTDEHYKWAEYAGLNDFLQVPKRDPNRPANEYGVDGAQLDVTGSRSNDEGIYEAIHTGNRKAWWTALFKEYGQWQKTTQDSFGNYENITFALFCYFNDLPRGTKPIFPADAPASAGGQASPAPGNPTGGSDGTMDAWAAAEVEPMIAAGMIPIALQKGYQGAISRLEYTQAAAQSLRASLGLDDAGLLAKFSKQALPAGTFSDTTDKDVLLVAALGLVEGTGAGKFSPATTLTREQAATILSRLSKLLGKSPSAAPLAFSDSARISSWAVAGVSTVSRIVTADGSKRVMEGSNGKFDPKAAYQRQQCYATLGRLLLD
jgi:hypothetical protein